MQVPMRRQHMSIYFRVFLMLALSLPVSGQKPAANKAAPSASKSRPLTVDGVIAMVQAGLSDDVITARLRKEDKAFDLSADDMIRLKQAKVSDAVLKVMLDPNSEANAPPPSSALAAVPAPAYAGLPYAKPSGATPALGAAETGDPNDPMAPHDSGI